MPPAVWIGPSALTIPCPVTDMEQLSNRLSKVFSDYPELFNHCVKVYQKRVDYYRLTSEGQKILQPDTVFHITARASIKTDGNEVKTEYYRLHVGGINDLPSEDALIGELHRFAEYMQQKNRAKAVEDLYIGPVLYEDDAAMELLAEKIADYSHSYWISIRNQSDRKHRYLGKQVFPPALSVCQLGNDSVYNGVKLLGYRQVDADGTKPKTFAHYRKRNTEAHADGQDTFLGLSGFNRQRTFRRIKAGPWKHVTQPVFSVSRPTAPSLIANFTNVFLKRPKSGLGTHLYHKKEQNLTLRVDSRRLEHRQGRTCRRKLQLSFTRTIQAHACHFKRRERL